MSVRRLVPLLALVAFLIFAVSAGAAEKTTYKTTIAVSLKFPAFHGKLHSGSNYCVADRKVKLYVEKKGPDKLLGTDKSEDDGSWEIPYPNLSSGAYYATVTAKSSTEVTLHCLAAKSKVAVVD